MNHLPYDDNVISLQIKVAALETLLLKDADMRREYNKLVDEATRRELATRIPAGRTC